MVHRRRTATTNSPAQGQWSRRELSLAVTGLWGLALLGAEQPARAQAKGGVAARILVMHATQSDGGASIDPRIGHMPQLKKPPFSAYNTYKLLEEKVLPLEKGKPSELALITGRTLQVTLLDETADKRFHVAAAVTHQSGQAFLKLLEVKAAANEPFFVAGEPYQGGTLVLGIIVERIP